jgi:hypothetical protein
MSRLALLGAGRAAATGGTYVGIGDIMPTGAYGYWGLRAYSNATKGDAIIRLRKVDNAESDFACDADGHLDKTAIDAWAGVGASLWVNRLYDMTGNSRHMLQAVAASQPELFFNVLNGHPVIRFAGARDKFLATINIRTADPPTLAPMISQSLTLSSVYKVLYYAGYSSMLGVYIYGLFTDSVSTIVNWGTAASSSTGDRTGLWTATNTTVNGSSSLMKVQGTAVETRNCGTGNSPDGFGITIANGAGALFTGDMTENILWDVGLTAGELDAVYANQASYWGLS